VQCRTSSQTFRRNLLYLKSWHPPHYMTLQHTSSQPKFSQLYMLQTRSTNQHKIRLTTFSARFSIPRGVQIFKNLPQNSKRQKVTSSKFHAKDPQILGVTVHNLEARTTWRPIFVHACPKQYKNPV